MSIKKVDNYRIRLNQILGVNGITYIGYNNLSKEQVVIKIIPKPEIAKKYNKNQQCFKQEVKFMHKIRKNASYVVRYLNLLETHNHFYLIQEFCKGGNLKKLLNEKKLIVLEAFKYMRHILKGFMELIKKGIIHGNLTPSNILFHNGLMRLADFGLKVNQDIESIYSRVKNTTYLAPEVLEGKRYTTSGHQDSSFMKYFLNYNSYYTDVCHGKLADLSKFTSKDYKTNLYNFPHKHKYPNN